MNIRQVLKAFTALRQLTDDESALLETLRGLNDAERESLVVALQPEKTATKRASKKSSKPASKSARGQSISSAIQRTAKVKANDVGDEFPDLLGGHEPCAFKYAHGEECQATLDANIHHMKNMTGYHPFEPAESSAPPARGRSSTNGGATASTQSLETETEDVSNVHHAGG